MRIARIHVFPGRVAADRMQKVIGRSRDLRFYYRVIYPYTRSI